MTREQLVKIRFKAYMEVSYRHPELDCLTPCMLVGIDFDDEVLHLRPFPEGFIEEEDFKAHISKCEIGRSGVRVTKGTAEIPALKDQPMMHLNNQVIKRG